MSLLFASFGGGLKWAFSWIDSRSNALQFKSKAIRVPPSLKQSLTLTWEHGYRTFLEVCLKHLLSHYRKSKYPVFRRLNYRKKSEAALDRFFFFYRYSPYCNSKK